MSLLLALIFQASAAAPPSLGVSRAPPVVVRPKMICEDIEAIGSRLSTKRICMTKDQWMQKRHDDQERLERRQVGPTRDSNSG